MRWVAFIVFGLMFPTVATAQVTSVPPGGGTLLAVTSSADRGGICGTYCVNPEQGIPLDYFATTSSVSALEARIDSALAAFNTQIGALNSQLGALNSQLGAINSQLGAINSQLGAINSQVQQTQRGLAATAAMANIWMPSAPGKTAWAVNGAAFMSDLGAGFSVAHRLNLSVPLAVTASYGNGGGNVHVGRIGLMGEF